MSRDLVQRVVRWISVKINAGIRSVLAVINSNCKLIHRTVGQIVRRGFASGEIEIVVKRHYIYEQAGNIGIGWLQPKITPQIFSAIALVAHHFRFALYDLRYKIGKGSAMGKSDAQRQ